MIAVDTNLLLYAHREETPWHVPARNCIQRLMGGGRGWAIPWPCIHEFLAISTHPRVFDPPTPTNEAFLAVESMLLSPGLHLLGEGQGYWPLLKEIVFEGHVVGPKVHDARVAAICLHHGVTELWTADRDFSRFRSLRTRNPLREFEPH